MVESYFPIYQLALSLQSLRSTALFFRESISRTPFPDDVQRFDSLLETIHQRCSKYGLTYTSDMAKRITDKQHPETYAGMFSTLDHLNDSLSTNCRERPSFAFRQNEKTFMSEMTFSDQKYRPRFHLAREIYRRREAVTHWRKRMHASIISCWFWNVD